MTGLDKIIATMRTHPKEMDFRDAKKVCDHYFGAHRRHGSHYVYPMPWAGDPHVNIQDRHGKVVGYQI